MYSMEKGEQLTLFPPGTHEHASLLVLPGSEKARMMTVTSGQKLLDYWHRYDPVGLLVRMLLDTSQWGSMTCFLTWETSGTPLNRLLFRLQLSELTTEEKEYLLWPTPTVNGNYNRKGLSKSSGDGLATAVRMWPTPRAFMWKDSTIDRGKSNLGEVVGGQLNPAWVEWLMGFPTGWTDLNHSEMQLYPSKSIPS